MSPTPLTAEHLAAQLGRPPSSSELLAARAGKSVSEIQAEYERAKQSWAPPTDPSDLPGPVTMDDVSNASRGGCVLGAAVTIALVALFTLGLIIGRWTAPEPNTKTHAAVCEMLDQIGADDTDGHAREFCP